MCCKKRKERYYLDMKCDKTGKRLREIRIKTGLSQDKFAELHGIKPPTYKKWERDNNPVPAEPIERIAKYYDIPPGRIMFGDDDLKDDLQKTVMPKSLALELVTKLDTIYQKRQDVFDALLLKISHTHAEIIDE